MTPTENSTGRFGMGMIIAAWVLGLGLATLLFNHYLAREHNPNKYLEMNPGSSRATVVLESNRAGHYVTDVRINGQLTEALIDTGATMVAIPATLAKKFQLTKGLPHTVQTANGNTTAYMTRIKQIQLGGIILHNINGSILQDNDLNTVLLGMSFLKHLSMTQKDHTLVLQYAAIPKIR